MTVGSSANKGRNSRGLRSPRRLQARRGPQRLRVSANAIAKTTANARLTAAYRRWCAGRHAVDASRRRSRRARGFAATANTAVTERDAPQPMRFHIEQRSVLARFCGEIAFMTSETRDLCPARSKSTTRSATSQRRPSRAARRRLRRRVCASSSRSIARRGCTTIPPRSRRRAGLVGGAQGTDHGSASSDASRCTSRITRWTTATSKATFRQANTAPAR